jgi:thiol-disulfide isomerase/thioredoxin
MTLPPLEAEDLDRVVADNDTVFLSYWRPGCPACKQFAPVLEAAAEKHPDIAFFRVNTIEQKDLAATFEVKDVPCLVVIRQSVMLAAQPGSLPSEVLEDLIQKVRALDMEALKSEMEAAQPPQEAQEE